MKLSETSIHPGGLFRCCLHSYCEAAEANPDRECHEGAIIECTVCHLPTMIFHDGIWCWNREGERDAVSTSML